MTSCLTQPHIVTDEMKTKIRALVAFGHTQLQIAEYLGVSEDTLQRHYRHELDTAVIDANMKVANRLFRKATEEGDTTSIIFWLKTRARWKEAKDETSKDSLVELLIKQLAKDQGLTDKQEEK